MHCASCAMAVEGALEDLAGVQSAVVHFVNQTADVEFDERAVTVPQLLAAVHDAGYTAHTAG